MAGGRISRDSSQGTTGGGANSLAGRDGAAFGSSSRAILWTAWSDPGRVRYRSAVSLQHDLGHHQSRSPGFHDFSAALHGTSISEVSLSPAPLPSEGKAEGVLDCRWSPCAQVASGHSLAGENAAQIRIFWLPAYSPELNPDELLNQDVKTNALGRVRPENLHQMMDFVRSYLRITQGGPKRVKRYFHEGHVQYAA